MLDTLPELALMLMSFLAVLSATRHNRHYDALHDKWTQCLISNREQFRAFFHDFRVTPSQAAHWLADGSSEVTVLRMLQGSGPFSGADLGKAALIQEARLAASLMWITTRGSRLRVAAPIRLPLPPRSTHRTSRTHVSQAEITALTREFTANARTAPFQATPSPALRQRGAPAPINAPK